MSKALESQIGGGHYKDMAIQPVEYINANKLGFIEGSVVKYVSRHRAKNGRQDVEKAIHFLQLLLELEYPDTKKMQEELPPAPVAEELSLRHGMLGAPELAEKVRRVNGEEVFVSKSLAEAVEGELQKSYHHGCSCGLFFKSLMELGVCECGKPTQGKWHG